jgi:peroxiredoxin Q/BCP
VLAISPQDVDSHERWAAQEGFAFALLADPGHVVIDAYGVGSRTFGVRRSIFVIDTGGVIRWRYHGTVRAIFKRPRQLTRILARVG